MVSVYGGGSTYNAATGLFTGPVYNTIGADGKVIAGAAGTANNVGDGLTNLNNYVNKGWNAQVNGVTLDQVQPTNNVNFVDGTNTKVTGVSDGTTTTYKYSVVDNPTFSGQVTANGGLSVSNNLTVQPNTTVNMGGNQIQGVAAGTRPTDAVNLGQLNTMSADLKDKLNGAGAAGQAQCSPMYAPGKWTACEAVGVFGNQGAASVAIRRNSHNGRWTLAAGVTATTKGQVGGRVEATQVFGRD